MDYAAPAILPVDLMIIYDALYSWCRSRPPAGGVVPHD